MSERPLLHSFINAGHRFDCYRDHTKVFALDDQTGMPLEAFPAVSRAYEPTTQQRMEDRVRAADVELTKERGPICATKCDVRPADPFKLWPEVEAASDRNTSAYLNAPSAARADSDDVDPASELAAVRTLHRLGYTWSGGKEWKPPIGKRPEWLDKEPERSANDVLELHKRLGRVEAYLADGDLEWMKYL